MRVVSALKLREKGGKKGEEERGEGEVVLREWVSELVSRGFSFSSPGLSYFLFFVFCFLFFSFPLSHIFLSLSLLLSFSLFSFLSLSPETPPNSPNQ